VVPEEDLDQQRDVAEQLGPGVVRAMPTSVPTVSATSSPSSATDIVQPQDDSSQSR
jgi:hypothetical protein